MGWQLYCVTYELLSPLHIGYHKVGNVQRTRYYVPARNVWAAVTEHLTRSGFSAPNTPHGDYDKIGTWVKEHCAFSYWFICMNRDSLLYPHFTEQGLWYGKDSDGISQAEFERRYLSTHVTTALDAATTSAETGSLHEVEVIAPHYRDNNDASHRTQIRGWVFMDDEGSLRLDDEIRWQQWLKELQVGGERRYGFGRLRLSGKGIIPDKCLGDSYEVHLNGERPLIDVKKGFPLLAHTTAANISGVRGAIEPLVGRETNAKNSASFGQSLTPAQVCWIPGSVVEETVSLILGKTGIWHSPTNSHALPSGL